MKLKQNKNYHWFHTVLVFLFLGLFATLISLGSNMPFEAGVQLRGAGFFTFVMSLTYIVGFSMGHDGVEG